MNIVKYHNIDSKILTSRSDNFSNKYLRLLPRRPSSGSPGLMLSSEGPKQVNVFPAPVYRSNAVEKCSDFCHNRSLIGMVATPVTIFLVSNNCSQFFRCCFVVQSQERLCIQVILQQTCKPSQKRDADKLPVQMRKH